MHEPSDAIYIHNGLSGDLKGLLCFHLNFIKL